MDKDNDMVLEYTILERDSYGKEIDNIRQKNPGKKWTVLAVTDVVEFKLKFKNPSFVNRIEIRGNNTQNVLLTFRDLDDEPVDNLLIEFPPAGKNAIRLKNVSIGHLISTVDVKLTSDDGKSKLMGLTFLIFRGAADMLKPNKEKHTNLSNEQTVKLETIHAPAKSKSMGTSRPYNFMRGTFNFENRHKRGLKTKPAQKKKQFKHNQDLDIDDFSKQDSDTLVIQPQRDYDVQKLGEIMEFLMHVNEEWLEAQSKMEEEMGVPEEERLSNYVKAIQIASNP